MAYISKDNKARIAPNVKAVLKKYNVKGTLSIENYMVLVLKIKKSRFDVLNETNPKYKADHFEFPFPTDSMKGEFKDFMEEVYAAMNDGNHDNSNRMIDHFDIGWYTNIRFGSWDKPYIVEK